MDGQGAAGVRPFEIAPGATVTIENITITGGNVTPFGSGGGIVTYGTASVINSTISNNSASNIGGIGNFGTLTLVNTIIANNTNGDCPNGSGTINASQTLIEEGLGCVDGTNTNNLTGDPLLDPDGLQDNGGPTFTHALCTGVDDPTVGCTGLSPAIDVIPVEEGTDAEGNPVLTDQRGEAHPQGAACDIGAVEVEMAALFLFNGFFPPVHNPPTVNAVKAGHAIPVKFSLGGDRGLAIFPAGYPASQTVACSGSAPLAPIEETVAAGSSGLHYDPASDTYTYVWETGKAWACTCQQLIVRLTDGTDHPALFQFK